MAKADRRVGRKKRLPSWKDQRWFEVVDRFDPAKIRMVASTNKSERMFVLGPIEDIVIVEVPLNAPVDRIQDVLKTFEERGLRALAFTDNTRFVKLRMCSDAEEEILNARDRETGGTGTLVTSPQRVDPGPGVRVDGVRGDQDLAPAADSDDGSAVDTEEQEEAPRPPGG